ncbi:MAG TPA: hypothetical protein VHO84_12435 [Syntrophorhabdaceae bacterium]|nr:hypothetical protein [Syntrophorhabdaceae bacterium]
MSLFIAFLIGFYFGGFVVSLLVVAGRKKIFEREEQEFTKRPAMEQMVLF